VARVWLTCFVVTALVVGGVIVFQNRAPKADGAQLREAPTPLTEDEIRTYIAVMPEIQRILQDVGAEVQAERRRTGGQFDEAAFGVKSRSAVDALLEKYHLTEETWDKLSKRVEYVVEAIRFVEEREEARPRIEEQITMKKALLANLGKKEDRDQLEKEIEGLEKSLTYEGPPVRQADIDLARQYWRTLDPACPRRTPPKLGK
jgi:hypothetical protein